MTRLGSDTGLAGRGWGWREVEAWGEGGRGRRVAGKGGAVHRAGLEVGEEDEEDRQPHCCHGQPGSDTGPAGVSHRFAQLGEEVQGGKGSEGGRMVLSGQPH